MCWRMAEVEVTLAEVEVTLAEAEVTLAEAEATLAEVTLVGATTAEAITGVVAVAGLVV
jgi:uncharacterized coiled-coil protein SlyX